MASNQPPLSPSPDAHALPLPSSISSSQWSHIGTPAVTTTMGASTPITPLVDSLFYGDSQHLVDPLATMDDSISTATSHSGGSGDTTSVDAPLSPQSQQLAHELLPANYLANDAISGIGIGVDIGSEAIDVGLAMMNDDESSMALLIPAHDAIDIATDMAMTTSPVSTWAGISPYLTGHDHTTTAAAAIQSPSSGTVTMDGMPVATAAVTPAQWASPDATQTYYNPVAIQQLYSAPQLTQSYAVQSHDNIATAVMTSSLSSSLLPAATTTTAAVVPVVAAIPTVATVATVVAAVPSVAMLATAATPAMIAAPQFPYQPQQQQPPQVVAAQGHPTATATAPTPAATATAAAAAMRRPPLQRGLQSACSICHAHKTRCDGQRPCSRCTRMGRQDKCVDRVKSRVGSTTTTATIAPIAGIGYAMDGLPAVPPTYPHSTPIESANSSSSSSSSSSASSVSPLMVAHVPITCPPYMPGLPKRPSPSPIYTPISTPMAPIVTAPPAPAPPVASPSPTPIPSLSPLSSSLFSPNPLPSSPLIPPSSSTSSASSSLLSSSGHPIGWSTNQTNNNNTTNTTMVTVAAGPRGVLYSRIPAPVNKYASHGYGSTVMTGGSSEPRRKRERIDSSFSSYHDDTSGNSGSNGGSSGTTVFDMVADDEEDYDDDARSLLVWLPGMKPQSEARTFRTALAELTPWLRLRLGHMYPDTSTQVIRYVRGLGLPRCRQFCPSCPSLNSPCSNCAAPENIMDPSSSTFSFSSWLISVFFAALWCPKEVTLLPSPQLDALPMASFAWSLLTDPTLSLHEYHEHVSGLLMPSQQSPSIYRTTYLSPSSSVSSSSSSSSTSPSQSPPPVPSPSPPPQPIVNAKFLEGGRHAVSNTLTPEALLHEQAVRDAKALALVPPSSLTAADAIEHASLVAAATTPSYHHQDSLPQTHSASPSSLSSLGVSHSVAPSSSAHSSLDNFVAFPSAAAPPASSTTITNGVSSSSESKAANGNVGYAGIDYSSPAMVSSPLTPRMRLGLSVNTNLERLLGYSKEEIRQRLEISGWRGMMGMEYVDEAKQMLRHHFRGMFGMRSDFSMIGHLTTKWGAAVRVMMWGRYDIVDGRARAASFYVVPVPIPAASRPRR